MGGSNIVVTGQHIIGKTMTLGASFGATGDLVKIGASARQRSRGSLAVLVVLTVGVCAVVLSSIVLSLVAVSYQVRAEHDAARRLVTDDSMAMQPDYAPLLASVMGDFAPNGFQFDVVLLGHHEDGVAPPPGVAAWPAPGEAYVSPALASMGVGDRYGAQAGQIGLEGLAAPNELLVYASPLPGTVASDRWNPYPGFGGSSPKPWWSADPIASFGQTTYINKAPSFILLVLLLALVPSLILLIGARELIDRDQTRRLLVIRTLGGSPRQERAVQLGEFIVPLAISAAVGVAAILVVCAVPITLPFVNYELPAAWFRSNWAMLVGGLACGMLLSSILLFGRRRNGAVDAVRPRRRTVRFPSWTAVLSPAFVLLAMWLPGFMDSKQGSTWELIFVVMSAMAIVTLPLTISAIIGAALAGLERFSRRRRYGSLLLAARNAATSPKAMTRAISALAVGVGLLFLTLFLANALGPRAKLLDEIAAQGGNDAVVAGYTDGIPYGAAGAIAMSLPNNVQLLRADIVYDESTFQPVAHIWANCAALTAVSLPCVDGKLTELQAAGAATAMQVAVPMPDATITVAEPGEWPQRPIAQTLIAYGTDAQSLQQASADIMTHTWPKNGISAPGWFDLSSSISTKNENKWVGFFGFFAVLIIAWAAAASVLVQFLGQVNSTVPLVALTSSTRPFGFTAATGLFLPLVAGGLGGVGLSLFLVQTPIAAGLAKPFGESIALTLAGCVLGIASVLALTAYLSVRRSARTWMPGDEAGI